VGVSDLYNEHAFLSAALRSLCSLELLVVPCALANREEAYS